MAGSYKEIVEEMKKVAVKGDRKFTPAERKRFAVAFKNLVDQLKTNGSQVVRDICSDVLGVLNNYLIPSASSEKSKAYYQRMKAEYLAYLVESTTGDDREEVKEKCLSAYKVALQFASQLLPAHPIRLGLAVHFFEFSNGILNSYDRALSAAFEEAIEELFMSPERFRDAVRMLRLLTGNAELDLYEESYNESVMRFQALRNRILGDYFD